MNWSIAALSPELLDQVLWILNDSIANDTALYEYQPRTLLQLQQWFDARQQQNLPMICIEQGKQLLGFGSYGQFRFQPAFKYCAEHSLYVHPDAKGQGVGRALLAGLVELAQHNGIHTLVGAIDDNNLASKILHQKLGFEHSGTIKQAGFKFGRWLDLALYQRLLNAPTNPIDG